MRVCVGSTNSVVRVNVGRFLYGGVQVLRGVDRFVLVFK